MAHTLEVVVKVENKLGLHIRPASHLVKLLSSFQAKVILTYKGKSTNACSIVEILILEAPKDAKIHVCAQGADATEAIRKLVEAFENRFGEEG